MQRAREFAGLLSSGAGSLLALVFVVAQVFLFVGGISYRKDCVTDQGQVRQDWTFTWFAPIPYLFRPSEPGCTVHTGTRVALNAVGIAGYAETSATSVADEWADRTGDAETSYWIRVRAALQDYANRNDSIRELDEAMASVEALLEQLNNLEAPPRFVSAHRGLTDALDSVRRGGEALQAAAKANDPEAYETATQRVEPDARRVQDAIRELDRLRKG